MRVGSSFWDYFLWYACILYWNNVTIAFHFCLSLWRTFIPSQLHYLYVQRTTYFVDVKIVLSYGNCWNVWISYGSYIVKWSYFTYIIFLADQLFDNVNIFDKVNPIQDGIQDFCPVTSTNVGMSPQNFLTFSFNPLSTLV